jgi:hypothetical protein
VNLGVPPCTGGRPLKPNIGPLARPLTLITLYCRGLQEGDHSAVAMTHKNFRRGLTMRLVKRIRLTPKIKSFILIMSSHRGSNVEMAV